MGTFLVFSATLLAGVLLSEVFHRSLLSTAVLFLGVGFVFGDGLLHVVEFEVGDESVLLLTEFTLFAVLFTDGMLAGLRDLTEAWRLPGRTLMFGLPLSLLAIATLAHLLTGLDWTESFLLGAALAATDPVFASAIVGREEVPHRLRHLLNVESGLNDGLALPVVVLLIAALGGRDATGLVIAEELVLGVMIGVVVPLVAIRVERSRFLEATEAYRPLLVFAIGLLVLALASTTHANLFLAAFAAGVTVQSVAPELAGAFHDFGELIAELLKLAALLVFASLISTTFLGEISVGGWAFAVAVLVVARPVAIGTSLLGARLGRGEFVAAAWFGPRGFASVVYGLLIVQSGIDAANEIFHLAAATIILSMVAHSSTDVAVVRWFRTNEGDLGADEAPAAGSTEEPGP